MFDHEKKFRCIGQCFNSLTQGANILFLEPLIALRQVWMTNLKNNEEIILRDHEHRRLVGDIEKEMLDYELGVLKWTQKIANAVWSRMQLTSNLTRLWWEESKVWLCIFWNGAFKVFMLMRY